MDSENSNIEPLKELTPKQESFCQEYVLDFNGTQAAIRAGYSENSAKEQASQHLTKLNIQKRIKELQKEKVDRNKITVDELVGILANQARFDLSECLNDDGSIKNISEIPIEHRQSLQGLDVFEITTAEGQLVGTNKKIKVVDRNSAIEKLMKHLGGYAEDNSQKDSSNVVVFSIPDNGRS